LWIPFLLLGPTIVLEGAIDEAALVVEPTEVAVGRNVVLRWNVPAGSRAFLSQVGILIGPNSGDLRVSPAANSDFILVVETADIAPYVICRHVTVSGSKGADDNSPDVTRSLPVKNEYDFGRLKLVDLSDLAQRILQKDFIVAYSGQRDGRVVIATGWSDSFIAVDPKDRLRRFHRIRYRVALSAVGKSAFAEISAEIHWRLPKDPTWIPENEAGALYPQMISELKQKLCGDCR
jgi:hypothetical protein